MNSHVNLSPIKLLVKGSVSRNDKAQAHQSHAGRASVTGSTQACPWFIALTLRGSYGGRQKTVHLCKDWKQRKAQISRDKGSMTSRLLVPLFHLLFLLFLKRAPRKTEEVNISPLTGKGSHLLALTQHFGHSDLPIFHSNCFHQVTLASKQHSWSCTYHCCTAGS